MIIDIALYGVTPAEVLAFYRRTVCDEECDEAYALSRAEEVCARFGVQTVKRVARLQAKAGHRWPVDDFFEVFALLGEPQFAHTS